MLAHDARQLLDLSATIGATPRLSTLEVSGPVFGSTGGGASCATAHQLAVTDVMAALSQVRDALTGDADRLLRVAFSYRETDQASADVGAATRQLRAGRGD